MQVYCYDEEEQQQLNSPMASSIVGAASSVFGAIVGGVQGKRSREAAFSLQELQSNTMAQQNIFNAQEAAKNRTVIISVSILATVGGLGALYLMNNKKRRK